MYMLRECVIDFNRNLDDHLPLIEFFYNNRWNSSILLASYEDHYGQRCRFLIGWFEVGESALIGLDLVNQDMENIKIIQERFNIGESHQFLY